MRTITGWRMLAAAAACANYPVAIAGASSTSISQNTVLRDWSLQDSIETRYLSGQMSQPELFPRKSYSDFMHFSPDGQFAFYVFHSGDLKSDSNVYTIGVIDTRAAQAILDGERTLKHASSKGFKQQDFTDLAPEYVCTIKGHILNGDQSKHLVTSTPTPNHKGADKSSTAHSRSKQLRAGSSKTDEDVNANPGCVLQLLNLQSHSSTIPAILDARWQSDSSGILFRGMADNGYLQAFRLDLRAKALRQLTSINNNVQGFSYRDGGLLYHTSTVTSEPAPYPYYSVGSEREAQSLLRAAGAAKRNTVRSAFAGYAGSRPVSLSHQLDGSWIAPGGKHAIVTLRNPDGNRQFATLRLDTGLTTSIPGAYVGRVTVESTQYVREAQRSYLGSSALQALHYLPEPRAIWVDSGQKVILVNTTSGESKDSTLKDEGVNIAECDLSTLVCRLITTLVSRSTEDRASFARSIVWNADGQQLVVAFEGEHSEGVERVYERDKDGIWTLGRTGAAPKSPLMPRPKEYDVHISVKQDENHSPLIIAQERNKELLLHRLNPQLSDVWLAQFSEIEWKESDGRIKKGGLLRPRPTFRGPLPLVIQLDAYDPSFFRPDGQSSAMYAAQALVAKGFVVAQIDMFGAKAEELASIRDEGPRVVERVSAAFRQIQRMAAIDSSRVAITGFSRAGFQVYYALSHPGAVNFSAAVVADAYTGGYPDYLVEAAAAPAVGVQEFENMPGGSFWEQKDAWLNHEITFNVDRIKSPVLFTAHGDGANSARSILQTIGAFRRNHKPIEYLHFPYAGHNLLRPKERLSALQALIDWMAFWLNRELPANANRAERWLKLQEQQEAILKGNREIRPPAGSAPPPADTVHPNSLH